MKVIVGLGNPGERYATNRHNTGFMLVDELANSIWQRANGQKINWESKFEALIAKADGLLLVKPQLFMNKSGEVVSQIMNFYKLTTADLWVCHDDLDIRLGEYKIVNGVGPKVHNGVNSVETQLGKTDFWRVRVGVDNRPTGEARTPGEEYVLADFGAEERRVIDGVIKEAADNLTSSLNL